jgi:plasmid stabilization system protein ParE
VTTTEHAASAVAQAEPSRVRRIVARALVVLGIVLLVISLFANFVRREALDQSSFRDTSQQLIANPDIQNQVAQTMVDQLYANVDVSQQLQQRLPDNLQSLAAPLAGLAREAIYRAARELLARPRVQGLFVDAASLAQGQVVRVLEGGGPRLETTNGDVVLDLRPLVVQLGDRFGFLGNVEESLPPDAGRVVILHSDQLKTAQNLTQWLKAVANWIWIGVLACWAVALWLVPGRRRRELRAIAIGVIVAGVALLVIRSLAGSYLVDHLVKSDTVRPSVAAFWSILSQSLADGAWVGIVIGVIAAVGAWVTGEGTRAQRVRATVAPWLSHAAAAWAVFAVALLLVVWALPLQRFLTAVILVILATVGFELIRRQVAAEAGETGTAHASGWSLPRLPHHRSEPAAPSPSAQVDELERLARLRADDLLTEEEYAAAKASALARAGD